MPSPLFPASHGSIRRLMDHLAVADPQAARQLRSHVEGSGPIVHCHRLEALVDEVISALAVELSFGRTLADGIGRLLKGGTADDLDRYLAAVKSALTKGPTLAALLARHLVPVLCCGDARLAERFERTTRTMLKKGTYTLKAPLETLSQLIEKRSLADADAFLDLLEATYARDISYNRTVYLTHVLPRAVGGFPPRRRLWQIRGLTHIMHTDEGLVDAYLQGVTSGLGLLSASALQSFLDHAVRRYQKDPESGKRFLALDSHQARERCRGLQVVVPLSDVRSRVERYLRARLGLAVAVRPLSELPSSNAPRDRRGALVRCDGRRIYLPDEMDLMDRRADNEALYGLLARLEAGAIEFGTFDLDLDKALGAVTPPAAGDAAEAHDPPSEMKRLLARFDNQGLALDLFTVFEHGRIARWTRRRYPGLARRLASALADDHFSERLGQPPSGSLLPLYRHVVASDAPAMAVDLPRPCRHLATRFHQSSGEGDPTVETSARLTLECYRQLADDLATDDGGGYEPLRLPFGRRYEPDRFGPMETAYHHLARDIHTRLAQRRLTAYRSDIRQLLVDRQGLLTAEDLKPLIISPSTNGEAPTGVDLSWFDVASLICRHGFGTPSAEPADGRAFRYREWDACIGDYLPDRVRVLERDIESQAPHFYLQTLGRFRGLVKRIRYAFDLMRPEEMTLLRQWREGDAFDYRALLDYAIDRKAGRMPSERLFIKRIKRIRDVAVLLLVDLSRSTANTVDKQGTRVLDVEKQAIVLLCEALRVVGDRFAIAGFSGTGPLGVDYYRIKELEAPFDDAVRGRIGAMAPQRNTRMGAAIRHATAQLSRVPARVRLILILGDGFPNDLEYKREYAVEDTRRAILEARADAVHVKAITVNVCDNGQLGRLYGANHHTLIGNVHDLPDNLVRVYSALTRH